jgi:Uma2 family endonuclease
MTANLRHDADVCRENQPMGLPKQKPLITVDQYLALERASAERHEYLDGVIYAMAGESRPHGSISVNLVGLLYMQLRGKPCQAFTKDTKVRSGPAPKINQSTKGLFSYPDIVVVCGEPQYHDEVEDVILNPSALIEVLSPTTEALDRGDKFIRYQVWNPTLRDYLLVSQKEPLIEHFQWQANDRWTYTRYSGLKATAMIPSIGCKLKLADVYDRVNFGNQPIKTARRSARSSER